MFTCTQNSQPLNGELKLKDSSSDEFSSQEMVYKQQHKIITVDKVLVKKLQFFTPGLPQDSNIIFFPSDEKFFLVQYSS